MEEHLGRVGLKAADAGEQRGPRSPFQRDRDRIIQIAGLRLALTCAATTRADLREGGGQLD